MFYSPTERLVYQPPIGAPMDPLVVHRRLVKESEGRINDWLEAQNSDQPLVAVEAEERLVTLARAVFGLQPLTETGGHTDAQSLGVLEHFLEYVTKKE